MTDSLLILLNFVKKTCYCKNDFGPSFPLLPALSPHSISLSLAFI